MELKKNPRKDINKRSGLYFAFGLVLVMLLSYVALEWKTYDKTDIYANRFDVEDSIDEEAPIFQLQTPPPPPPPPVAPVKIEIAEDDSKIEETVIETTDTNQDNEIIDVDSIVVDEFIDDEPIPFSVIEHVPVFPGCENDKDKRACFNKMIQKHIVKNFRYPEIAQEMGIQGRVNIMFVIQKDGSIGQIQLRGPDKNLEKEAKRIIDKLPKMTPGKQRGTAVKVPFSIPINFKLQ